MADTHRKECANETCDVVFETTNPRKKYHDDACRLEQWERDKGVAHKWVKEKPKRKGPAKPRTHWKDEYEAAVDAVGVLIDEIAGLQSQLEEST